MATKTETMAETMAERKSAIRVNKACVARQRLRTPQPSGHADDDAVSDGGEAMSKVSAPVRTDGCSMGCTRRRWLSSWLRSVVSAFVPARREGMYSHDAHFVGLFWRLWMCKGEDEEEDEKSSILFVRRVKMTSRGSLENRNAQVTGTRPKMRFWSLTSQLSSRARAAEAQPRFGGAKPKTWAESSPHLFLLLTLLLLPRSSPLFPSVSQDDHPTRTTGKTEKVERPAHPKTDLCHRTVQQPHHSRLRLDRLRILPRSHLRRRHRRTQRPRTCADHRRASDLGRSRPAQAEGHAAQEAAGT